MFFLGPANVPLIEKGMHLNIRTRLYYIDKMYYTSFNNIERKILHRRNFLHEITFLGLDIIFALFFKSCEISTHRKNMYLNIRTRLYYIDNYVTLL